MLTLLILPKLPFAIFTMEKRSGRLLYTLYSAVKISFSQDQKQPEKNVLAENLARAFRRPCYNLSFHINMDASSMIGNDTFRNGEVVFRPGPIYQSAVDGGFCILDEINMARNEALAVLHSVLDFRRTIHIPGYDQIPVHPATRFIATMNYGYAGTKGTERGSRLPVCDPSDAFHHAGQSDPVTAAGISRN